MKYPRLVRIPIFLAFALSFLFSGILSAAEPYQLTAKAWDAIAKGEYEEVVSLANESDRRWGSNARAINKKLGGYAKESEVKKYATLNELATITMIKAQALEKMGDIDGAVLAYQKLLDDFNYGQAWDNAGWWWKPSEVAFDAINKLAPGTLADIELETPPLDPALRLPGKKGIGFPLRDPSVPRGAHQMWEDSWDINIPKIKQLKPYWNYSWGPVLVPPQPENIEFLPMSWGAYGEEFMRKEFADGRVKEHIASGRIKRYLGFNEPDHKGQADVDYMTAIEHWPILEELGVPLVSPACANTLGLEVDDSTQGIKGTWMRDFMREVDERGYRVDYIGTHWYGGASPATFKRTMIRIYEKYGRRPLLITEFSPGDWKAKTPEEHALTKEEVLDFMKEVLPWMERQNWIAGYAWFCWTEDDAPGASSALFDRDDNITALGRYYMSVTNENPDGDQSIVYEH